MRNAILGHVMQCRVVCRFLCTMKVNKKPGKRLDAAQAEPPTVEKFINALKKTKEDEEREACDTALFPHNEAVSHLEKKPKGR